MSTSEPAVDTTDTVVVKPQVVTPIPVPTPQVETYELTVYAVDTCYVKIEDADSVIYERTLWPRNRVTEELKDEVKVSLGNPGKP